MSNQLNQQNKEAVWDFWQKLNHVGIDNLPELIRAAVHEDVNWNVSAPIDQVLGVDALIADYWLPLRQSFPDLKRAPHVFMGGIDESSALYATEGGEEWVSGCGYLTGAFVKDWLGIPATGKKTNIWFGEFYVMREGKIAECYLQLDVLAVMRQAGYQVLPPAPGAEGGKVPGPIAKDGILLLEQDLLESRKSIQLVQAMGRGMRRYVRSRDGGDLRSMEQDKYLASRYEVVRSERYRRLFHAGGIRRLPSATLAGGLRRPQLEPRRQWTAYGTDRRRRSTARVAFGIRSYSRHNGTIRRHTRPQASC